MSKPSLWCVFVVGVITGAIAPNQVANSAVNDETEDATSVVPEIIGLSAQEAKRAIDQLYVLSTKPENTFLANFEKEQPWAEKKSPSSLKISKDICRAVLKKSSFVEMENFSVGKVLMHAKKHTLSTLSLIKKLNPNLIHQHGISLKNESHSSITVASISLLAGKHSADLWQ